MKYKLNKKAWKEIGLKTGWLKQAQFDGDEFDEGVLSDRVEDLVEKSLRDPQALKEFLRDNPEIQDSLSQALEYQHSGVDELDLDLVDEDTIVGRFLQ